MWEPRPNVRYPCLIPQPQGPHRPHQPSSSFVIMTWCRQNDTNVMITTLMIMD
jgi:hypothetical protein